MQAEQKPIDYGITADQVQRTVTVGGVLGFLLVAIALPVGIANGTIRSLWDTVHVILFSLAVAAILPVTIGFAGIIHLRIDSREIQQMIGPWVFARQPINALRSIEFGGRVFPVCLKFVDGAQFRLLALHLRSRSRLARVLQAEVPGLAIKVRSAVAPLDQ